MGKKKVTLSIDSRVYDGYRTYCAKRALQLSKKVELFMQGELRKQR